MYYVKKPTTSQPLPDNNISCSDCKIELANKTWLGVLLNWLNKCVNPELPTRELTERCLTDIINKYKEDIVKDDIDRAILCTNDLEPFLRFKYPILRLRYFSEDKDQAKKLWIMTSVLFYHCCIHSHGAVENDICAKLSKIDREIILCFCESLSDMEITVNNVENAIRIAVETLIKTDRGKSFKRKKSPTACLKTAKERSSTRTSSPSSRRTSTLTFRSSVTVLPHGETPSYSKTDCSIDQTEYTTDTATIGGDTIAVYNANEANKNTNDSPKEIKKKIVDDSPERKTVPLRKQCSEPISIKLQEKPIVKQETFKLAAGKSKNTKDPSTGSDLEKIMEQLGKQFEDTKKPTKRYAGKDKRQPSTVTTSEGLTTTVTSSSLRSQSNTSYTSVSDTGVSLSAGDVDTSGYRTDMRPFVGYERAGPKQMKRNTKVRKRNRQWSDTSMSEPHYLKANSRSRCTTTWKIVIALFICIIIAGAGIVIYYYVERKFEKAPNVTQHQLDKLSDKILDKTMDKQVYTGWTWQCKQARCTKVLKPKSGSKTYSSLSRCVLLCSGPQLWPKPLGDTHFGNKLVGSSTDKLEYKFEAGPSDMVHQYLSEAFKLFLGDLARLERMETRKKVPNNEFLIKKMHIYIKVIGDPDPRIRTNTDESYHLKIEDTGDKLMINIQAQAFAGVRHGLETLSQVILLDQTSGHLITLDAIIIRDAPSYKYRGLMLDTGRNYIPVGDILRTIDGMAMCKLNTFHWRISDSTSFPLFLPTMPNLFEYGAYDRSMIYTKDDVKTVVTRAGVRGIRVLIEVAAPGPVGRAWSWSEDAVCQKKNENVTCENIICTRLNMRNSLFGLLQHIYSEIIDMTGVDDVFHLSDSMFSLSNCYQLLEDREGFLEKALGALKLANKGFLPNLPIVWYTPNLNWELSGRSWERYGVQVHEWPTQPDNALSRYKMIHSVRWDLSCQVERQRCMKYRSWQEMYGWKSWLNIEAFSIEGGEALMWTDLVDSGNLDYHLWPRLAAVSERLWSDIVANATAEEDVYIRLDNHRWRLLFRGLKVQPIWPVWCSFNPTSCVAKLSRKRL